jgi:hypothetical protein
MWTSFIFTTRNHHKKIPSVTDRKDFLFHAIFD